MNIPTEYAAGFAEARKHDPQMAETYLRFISEGDPLADAALASLPPGEEKLWIQRGIEEGGAALADAPEPMRALFAEIERVPDWYDPKATRAGSHAFHANMELLLGAFVGAVLVEGFATMISKSFAITGRVTDTGVSRMHQNNRHLVEIFMMGGLDRQAEGWKLSVRIRMIHARVRQMLNTSDEWDKAAWGVPLSSSHIAFAASAFSGQLLMRGKQLGLKMTQEEVDSFMHTWRYSGHLMGVPLEMQAVTAEDAQRIVRIGRMCEPPPHMEAILVANGLINSAALVAGITDPDKRRKLAQYVYRVSRALLGDEMADQLNFPKLSTFGVLPFFRLRARTDRLMRKWIPGQEGRRRAGQYSHMLGMSYDDKGPISYRLPAKLHAESDRPD